MTQVYQARRAPDAGSAASWDEWWQAIRAEPALAELVAERDRLGHGHPHGRHELSDDDHRRLLHEASFVATDVVWRQGDDRILAALR